MLKNAVSGTASFTVNVTDFSMNSTDIRTASQTFSITVNPVVLNLPSATLPNR